jgi:hypothetical protein
MTTLGNSDVGHGTLTTSSATLHTAGAGSKEEAVTILFINYSASTITVDVTSNGTADVNRLTAQPVSLLTKESMVIECSLGPSDDIRAFASAGTSIKYSKFVRVVA